MGEGPWWGRGGPRRVRRVHGLQLPLHPQQVLAWVVMAAFTALMYGAVVPALHSRLVTPVSVVTAILFAAHIATHAAALALDPADPQLRSRKDRNQVPEFDRSVHAHVIENGRCHLCNITITSTRTKHCSACNKCVDVFDHHCKWLNHCIGVRNYRVFLACVATAILACLLVMAACLAEIVLYYFNKEYLAPWQHLHDGSTPQAVRHGSSKTQQQQSQQQQQGQDSSEGGRSLMCYQGAPYCHFRIFGTLVYDGAFIGLLSTLFSLALVAEVLLVHLAAFHVYIIHLGLTTYEYIRGYHVRGSASNHSFSTYGGRSVGGASSVSGGREGAMCGWPASHRRGTNNQITPSSTTDTALLSPNSLDSVSTTGGLRSPRSSTTASSGLPTPTTPVEGTNNKVPGAKQQLHQYPQHPLPYRGRGLGSPIVSPTNTAPRTPPARPSQVPTLPHIHAPPRHQQQTQQQSQQRIHVRTLSRSVASVEYGAEDDFDDGMDVDARLAIPRPRPSRRRLRSSVAPHLSPIKECDQSAPSPPCVRSDRRGGAATDSPGGLRSRSGSAQSSPARRNSPSPDGLLHPTNKGSTVRHLNGHAVINVLGMNGGAGGGGGGSKSHSNSNHSNTSSPSAGVRTGGGKPSALNLSDMAVHAGVRGSPAKQPSSRSSNPSGTPCRSTATHNGRSGGDSSSSSGGSSAPGSSSSSGGGLRHDHCRSSASSDSQQRAASRPSPHVELHM